MKTIPIEKFKGLDIEIKNLSKIVQMNAYKGSKVVSENSPIGVRGTYKRGWTYNLHNKGKNDVEGVVFNKTDWQLTWLIEKGHFITNKNGGVGRTQPNDHIKRSFNKQAKDYKNDMRNNLEVKVKFK